MPILNVKVSAARSLALTKAISEILLEHTTRILHKKRELTAIAIDYVDPDDWIVGGQSLSSQGKTSFYFDIKVVDETNTKSEKAQYIDEVFAAFGKLFGDVHPESYIYIQDVRPAAFGFDQDGSTVFRYGVGLGGERLHAHLRWHGRGRIDPVDSARKRLTSA